MRRLSGVRVVMAPCSDQRLPERSLRRSVVAAVVCLAALTAIGGAQQASGRAAPAPQAPQPAPVFRASVDFVNVDVVVTDDHDRPIPDLTAADFEVTQSGHPQKIAAFEYVSIPVAHRTIDLTQPAPPPPDVATNAPPSAQSRLFVLLIDDLHLMESLTPQIKKVMTDFLSRVSPDDEIAIIFTGHSDLSVNFTTDLGRLQRTIDNLKAAIGFGEDALGAAADQPISAAANSGKKGVAAAGPSPSTKFQPTQLQATLADARSTLSVLDNVASALANSGHLRRAILLVSTGTILPPPAPGQCPECQEFQTEMQATFEKARRADVPIYSLDPRGVPDVNSAVRGCCVAPGGPQASPSSSAAGPPPPPQLATMGDVQNNIYVEQDHLSELAVNTGGRAFINRANLTDAVAEMVEENGSFYELGFTPDPAVHDGQFHSVTVKVKRPGAHVRARAGYVAPSAIPASTSSKVILAQALTQGVDVSNLTLRAFAAPLSVGTTGMTTVVTVDLSYPLAPSPHRRVDDDLALSIAAVDSDAKVKLTMTNSWHVSGMVPGDANLPIRLNQIVDIPPSSSREPLTVKVGVASQALGEAGTVQFALDVPNVSNTKLAIGGVVVGLPGAPDVLTVGADRIRPVLPFQPVTTRAFAATDTIRVYAPVFWNGKDPVDATVTVTGARSTPPQHLSLTGTPTAGGRQQAVVDVTIPLKELAPGPCGIEIAVQAHGVPPVRRVVPCTIDAPR